MLLKLGSSGEDVKKLQIKLGLKDDGDFGKETELAVIKWQKLNGLKDDGLVGPLTLARIFSDVKSNYTTPLQFIKKLRGHIPDGVYSQIESVCESFNIKTPLRLAHFLSQCGHESGNFRAVSENLNYSSDGLKEIFGKYFPNDTTGYSRNPEKIANKVYANRMGNGNESSKEGFKFRGRGYIQLTGKDNYTRFSKFIGEDCVSKPDLVATKYPLASAAFFFDSNNLWKTCDLGSSDDVVTKVTRRVNGGTNGLDDRIKHFKEFYNIIK